MSMISSPVNSGPGDVEEAGGRGEEAGGIGEEAGEMSSFFSSAVEEVMELSSR